MKKQTRTRKTRHSCTPILFIIVFVALVVFTIQSAIASRSQESEDLTSQSARSEDQADQNNSSADTDGKENEGWTEITMSEEDLSRGDLILVSNKNPYDFSNKLDLVSIFDYKTDSYNVRDKEVLLQEHVMEHLNSMLDDFSAESGLRTINVVAGYRSYEYQQTLYDASAAANGEEHAAKYVAAPGGSEHHTGLAVDLGIYYTDSGVSEEFTGTGDFAWIDENAWKYGFVQRYESGKEDITAINEEPWHFRYVGLPHAQIIVDNDFCLEEYLDYLKGFPFDGEHLNVESQGQKYEIYFCKGFDVYVPKDNSYDISGNNVDGFIVTVYQCS